MRDHATTRGRPESRLLRLLRSRLSPLVVAGVAAVLLLWAGTRYVDSHRVDPSSVPQSEYHRLGTSSARATFGDLPKRRLVLVEEPPEHALTAIVRYLPPPVGEGGRAEAAGRFDPSANTILICDDLAALEASLPEPVRSRMDGAFLRVLRHEYGHALLEDWLRTHSASPPEYEACQGAARAQASPNAFPQGLRPAVIEWLSQRPTVYGLPHFASAFTEYFAESYARLLSGKAVAPRMGEFLHRLSSPGSRDANDRSDSGM